MHKTSAGTHTHCDGATHMTWAGESDRIADRGISGDWGVAVVLTLLELGWYGGGIFGAVAGAYGARFSRIDSWEHFRAALKESFAEPGVSLLAVPVDRDRNVAQIFRV